MQYLIEEAVMLRGDVEQLVARQQAERQAERASAVSDAHAEAAKLLADRKGTA